MAINICKIKINLRFTKYFRNWLNTGLGFIWPEVCQVCEVARATPAEGFVCGECRQQVRLVAGPFCQQCGLPFNGALTTDFSCSNCQDVTWYFSSARAAVISQGVARDIILRYKYQRARWFEPFLAEFLVRAAVPVLAGQNPTLIVPVPLHPVKEREREFNQAARLGQHLAKALGIPLNAKILRRVSFTVTQTKLSRAERASNMRAVFALKPGISLAGQNIVLVDDVFTTGATTNACARVLHAAGAAQVCVWTVARQI
jgi:ComF family protein